MEKGKKAHIDTPFTSGVAGNDLPSLTGAKGCYDYLPGLGTKGNSGGLPLKFVDESIPFEKPATGLVPAAAKTTRNG